MQSSDYSCRECGTAITARSKSGLCQPCRAAEIGRANRKVPDPICENCGEVFRGPNCGSRRFCSRECYLVGYEAGAGENAPNWRGDKATIAAHRWRAQQLFPLEPCDVCGTDEDVVRHHIDGNPANNVRENIRFLCRRHHSKLHFEQGDMKIGLLSDVRDVRP